MTEVGYLCVTPDSGELTTYAATEHISYQRQYVQRWFICRYIVDFWKDYKLFIDLLKLKISIWHL